MWLDANGAEATLRYLRSAWEVRWPGDPLRPPRRFASRALAVAHLERHGWAPLAQRARPVPLRIAIDLALEED